MKLKAVLLGTAMAVTGLTMAAPADAQDVIRWASASDALTLDPHSQNEGPTSQMLIQMYDYLIERDIGLAKRPALATSWVAIDEDTWELELRQGVTFHNGAPFMANDAVFSLNRAMTEPSDFRNYLSSVTSVEAVDDYTIHIHTDGPNPILPDWLTGIFIMDEEWAIENGVETAQDFAEGEENFAVRNANGTGPFRLESRQPDVQTVLVRNETYWGADAFPNEVDTIIYTPVASAATRVAALLSGEVDFISDPPTQDLGRLDADPGIDVVDVNQIRTIFFGMNVAADDLENDTVDGANPFQDIRVREAFYRSINIDAIQQVVMRGLSVPAGMITSPGVNGYATDLDERLPFDQDGARALLAEAGYPDGFGITLHCPNDRYVNDEATCQAVVAMLGQIGVTVTLQADTRSVFFGTILAQGGYDTSFYMLGWTPSSFDSYNPLFNLVSTRDPETGRGTFNVGGYSNERIDALTAQILAETDETTRNTLIAEAWQMLYDDYGYLPLHQQGLAWGVSEDASLVQRADNVFDWTLVRIGG